MYLTSKELRVIISLINSEQFDGARYKLDHVDLSELRERIKEYLASHNTSNKLVAEEVDAI